MPLQGTLGYEKSCGGQKQAFGAIQLPRVEGRYITPKKKHKKYCDLSKSERNMLSDYSCPVCKDYSLNDLVRSFKLKAMVIITETPRRAWRKCPKGIKLRENYFVVGGTVFKDILPALLVKIFRRLVSAHARSEKILSQTQREEKH